MKHTVTMIYGTDATSAYANDESITRAALDDLGTVQDFEFDTLAELNAFLLGVSETVGWLECEQVDGGLAA